MKNKILLFALISLMLNQKSFGQLMTFGFVKNCMTYKRSTVTDELTKKQFFVVDRTKDGTNNPLMEGATYYSNAKQVDASKGEIGVLSLINGTKQVTEISFVSGSKNDYSKNYTDVFNQMIKFFNNEQAFKSERYNKTEVLKFSKDKLFYYVFKNKETPTIVISNYKIDAEYF
ncbi:MAG: hypothetical protein H0W84_12345 [Bacteroidetes bacterium]|nr:hypothetical protein [Bacteroidota bacterium]